MSFLHQLVDVVLHRFSVVPGGAKVCPPTMEPPELTQVTHEFMYIDRTSIQIHVYVQYLCTYATCIHLMNVYTVYVHIEYT